MVDRLVLIPDKRAHWKEDAALILFLVLDPYVSF